MTSCGETRFIPTRRRTETSGSLSDAGRLRENGDSCCPLTKTGGDQLAKRRTNQNLGRVRRVKKGSADYWKFSILGGGEGAEGRRKKSACFFILFILRELSAKGTDTGSVEAAPWEPTKERPGLASRFGSPGGAQTSPSRTLESKIPTTSVDCVKAFQESVSAVETGNTDAAPTQAKPEGRLLYA